jgi:hypothetical protein
MATWFRKAQPPMTSQALRFPGSGPAKAIAQRAMQVHNTNIRGIMMDSTKLAAHLEPRSSLTVLTAQNEERDRGKATPRWA